MGVRRRAALGCLAHLPILLLGCQPGAPGSDDSVPGVVTSTVPPSYPDHRYLMAYIDERGRERPVITESDWSIRRHHILESMQMVMGPYPSGPREPLYVETRTEIDRGTYVEKRITFLAEPGDRVPAYLLVPKYRPARAPAMLCLHETTEPHSLGKAEVVGLDLPGALPNLAYAQELTETRGYVTLAPDYPGFGEYQTDPYLLGYQSATMKGLFNHSRAIDLLESLPEVDPSRIGVIGHSLGGVNALFLAVFDPRPKVVVSSCGFTTFDRYMNGDLTPWAGDVFMPRIHTKYHDLAADLPFDFPEVLGAVAPARLFINAPIGDTLFDYRGTDESVRDAYPVFALLGLVNGPTLTHPTGGHDFPSLARQAAYDFIDRALR